MKTQKCLTNQMAAVVKVMNSKITRSLTHQTLFINQSLQQVCQFFNLSASLLSSYSYCSLQLATSPYFCHFDNLSACVRVCVFENPLVAICQICVYVLIKTLYRFFMAGQFIGCLLDNCLLTAAASSLIKPASLLSIFAIQSIIMAMDSSCSVFELFSLSDGIRLHFRDVALFYSIRAKVASWQSLLDLLRQWRFFFPDGAGSESVVA